jgi:hypothetical protein
MGDDEGNRGEEEGVGLNIIAQKLREEIEW